MSKKIISLSALCFLGLSVATVFAEDAPKRGPLASALMSDSYAEKTGLDIRGWISAGGTLNPSNGDKFNGPVAFNDRADQVQLDQAYLILEKKVPASPDTFSLGGRIDGMFGADGALPHSVGFDDKLYGSEHPKNQLAIPQAYLEANLPVGTGLDLKVGHFYTLLGYEVVTSPDNFFYSHSYSMEYAEPFTHWGALASYNISDELTASAGAVRGWDNLKDPADANLMFLGGITYKPCEDTTAVFSLTSGNQGYGQNLTAYSLVVTHIFDKTWSYVFQHDLGAYDTGDKTATWYSLDNNVFYEISDTDRLGLRLEWFKDSDGTRVAGPRSGSAAADANYYELTLGAQHKFTDHFMLRPEIRYDWQSGADAGSRAFNNGKDKDQILLAANVVFTF